MFVSFYIGKKNTLYVTRTEYPLLFTRKSQSVSLSLQDIRINSYLRTNMNLVIRRSIFGRFGALNIAAVLKYSTLSSDKRTDDTVTMIRMLKSFKTVL